METKNSTLLWSFRSFVNEICEWKFKDKVDGFVSCKMCEGSESYLASFVVARVGKLSPIYFLVNDWLGVRVWNPAETRLVLLFYLLIGVVLDCLFVGWVHARQASAWTQLSNTTSRTSPASTLGSRTHGARASLIATMTSNRSFNELSLYIGSLLSASDKFEVFCTARLLEAWIGDAAP